VSTKTLSPTVSKEVYDGVKAYRDAKGVKVDEAAALVIGTGLSRLAALSKHSSGKAKTARAPKAAKAAKAPKAAKAVKAKPAAKAAAKAAPAKAAAKTATKKTATKSAKPAKAAKAAKAEPTTAAATTEAVATEKPVKKNFKDLIAKSAKKAGIDQSAPVAQA
jgi:hypothetical protein